jgi:hypothetical protein
MSILKSLAAIGAARPLGVAACILGILGACGQDGGAANDTDGGPSPETLVSEAGVVDAPADTLRDAFVPPNAPYDWVGVIGTGQSLSIGWTAEKVSVKQPFGNLKLADNGPDPRFPIADASKPQWTAVPLTEPIRSGVSGSGPGYGDGQYPANIAGETPHSGMANTLSSLWKARGGQGDYVTAHSVVGWSGHNLRDIDKQGGMRAYPASLNEARVFKSLSTAAGKTFGYGGVILTHGEADAGNGGYGGGIFQLWKDYNADLKAITGQTDDIVLFASQQSTIPAGSNGSAIQVWKAGVEHPGKIVCTGPKYQYSYNGDNLHFLAPGYVRLGEKYAEVFDLVVNQKVAWKPLQPNKITRSGATITIDFDVPNAPLAWDEHLPAPHQQAHKEWSKGRGFEVNGNGGAPLTIVDTKIVGNSVVLTLDAAPAGAISVAYALTQDGGGIQGGTGQGMFGQLRDSDEFVGYDAETIEASVTNGSTAIKSTAAGGFVRRAGHDIVTGPGLPAGVIVRTHDSDDNLTLSTPWPGPSGKATLSFHHDEHNYCVHFSMAAP